MEVCVSACREVFAFEYECPTRIEALDISGDGVTETVVDHLTWLMGTNVVTLGRATSILKH